MLTENLTESERPTDHPPPKIRSTMKYSPIYTAALMLLLSRGAAADNNYECEALCGMDCGAIRDCSVDLGEGTCECSIAWWFWLLLVVLVLFACGGGHKARKKYMRQNSDGSYSNIA